VKGSHLEAELGGKTRARAMAVAEDELTTDDDSELLLDNEDEEAVREAFTRICKRVRSLKRD